MKGIYLLLSVFVSFACHAQDVKTDTISKAIADTTLKAKVDTIQGVVVYTAASDLIHISKGDYHTYTVEAVALKTDTGFISIRTELGYLDLKKNYQFIPMNKLQPSRLKKKQ